MHNKSKLFLVLAVVIFFSAITFGGESPKKEGGKNSLKQTKAQKNERDSEKKEGDIAPEKIEKINKNLKECSEKVNSIENNTEEINKKSTSIVHGYNSLNQKIDRINSSNSNMESTFKEVQTGITTVKSRLVGMIIVISIMGGFCLLLLGATFWLLFKTEKISKCQQKNAEENTDFVTFTKESLKSVSETVNVLPDQLSVDKSISAITSGIEAKLRGQFDALRKAMSTESQKDTFEKIRNIETLLQKDNARLREQEHQIHEERSSLKIKTAEADRKKREAEECIANCEKDKARAVAEAKTEVQTACQRQALAEQDKLNKSLEQIRSEKHALSELLMHAKAEIEKMKSDSFNAETAGFERGVREERERNRILERENEKLNNELAEKDRSVALIIAEKQNIIQAEAEQKFSSKISVLENSCQEKDNTVARLTKEKAEKHEECSMLKAETAKLTNELFSEKSAKQLAENNEKKVREELQQEKNQVSVLLNKNETLETQVRDITANLSAKNEQISKQQEALDAAERKIAEMHANIYPAAFIADLDFDMLKEHLESWGESNVQATSIIKSSLTLFAQKENVNTETWQLALRNIAWGISYTMLSQNKAPDTVLTELVLWSKFLMKFSNEDFDFSLKLPNIGDSVDPSWITSRNKNLSRVNTVLTWAVWNNQFGVRHNAEVE